MKNFESNTLNDNTEVETRWDILTEDGDKKEGGQETRNEAVEENERVIGDRPRQYAKLVATIARRNINYMGARDVESLDIDKNDVDKAREMLTDGTFGKAQQKELLSCLARPLDLDPDRKNEIYKSMFDDKREIGILGDVLGVKYGNAISEGLNADSILKFMSKYPTPVDFESKRADFMARINKYVPKEYGKFERAMDSLEHKIYGKRKEYYDRIEEMRAWGAPERPAEESARGVEARGAQETREQIRDNMVERVKGPGFKEAAFYGMAREQVRAGERASLGERLEASSDNQDSELILADKGMFGVFDGAGGMGGGREASQTAKNTVEQIMQTPGIEPRTGADLAQMLNAASQDIDRMNKQTGGKAMTTGVLARIVERPDGSKQLAFASAGDSRIYVVNGDQVRLLTRDEGYENKVSNSLGGPFYEPSATRTKQYGEVNIRDGDRIVLCSDGITGDRGTDLMDERELGGYVSRSGNTAVAAQVLTENARKKDDRTAIVVEV